MAYEQGDNWRLHIKVGNAYVPIAGETNLEWQSQNTENDISDKDSGVYGATQYGNKKITFTVAGNLKLPDPGFAALEAASNASPPAADIQIKKGTIIKYQGPVGIGNFSATFPKGQPATYSVNLANSAAPTVNALSAADASS